MSLTNFDIAQLYYAKIKHSDLILTSINQSQCFITALVCLSQNLLKTTAQGSTHVRKSIANKKFYNSETGIGLNDRRSLDRDKKQSPSSQKDVLPPPVTTLKALKSLQNVKSSSYIEWPRWAILAAASSLMSTVGTMTTPRGSTPGTRNIKLFLSEPVSYRF